MKKILTLSLLFISLCSISTTVYATEVVDDTGDVVDTGDSNNDTTCPTGEIWSNTLLICVTDTSSDDFVGPVQPDDSTDDTTDTTCPDGQEWSEVSHTCNTITEDVTCPTGEIWSEPLSICIIDTTTDDDIVGPVDPGDTTDDDTDDPEETTSVDDYERIEKINGIWYGIIEVTDIYIEQYGLANSSIYLNLDRDLKSLVEIEFDYKVRSCYGVRDGSSCWGIWGDYKTGTLIIENEIEDGTTSDIWFDSITNNILNDEMNEQWDWVITSRLVDIVDIIQFTYILTDEEVDSVNAEIKEQFLEEAQLIIDNSLLTEAEKLTQLAALELEYSEYNLEYDELITSVCVGDGCYGETTTPSNADDYPEWYTDLLSTILKGVGYIVAAIMGVSAVGIIAYLIVSKLIKETGNATVFGIKAAVRSGGWWGANIGRGILAIIDTILLGIKSIFRR